MKITQILSLMLVLFTLLTLSPSYADDSNSGDDEGTELIVA